MTDPAKRWAQHSVMFDGSLLKDSMNIALGARVGTEIEEVNPILDTPTPPTRRVFIANALSKLFV